MYRAILTFDLAILSTGVAIRILNSNGDTIKLALSTIKLALNKTEHYEKNFYDIKNEIKKIKNFLKNNGFVELEQSIIDVGIELSNFGNPRLVNSFNLICGMFLSNIFDNFKINILKIFPANSWYKLYSNIGDDSKTRKIKIASEMKLMFEENIEFSNDDESDALGINMVFDEIQDTFESTFINKSIAEEKNNASKFIEERKTKILKRISVIENDLIEYKNKSIVKPLINSQVTKCIKLQEELKELKWEIEK